MMHEYDDHLISCQLKHCLILIILMATMMSETTVGVHFSGWRGLDRVDKYNIIIIYHHYFSDWRSLDRVDMRSRCGLSHQAHLPCKVILLHYQHQPHDYHDHHQWHHHKQLQHLQPPSATSDPSHSGNACLRCCHQGWLVRIIIQNYCLTLSLLSLFSLSFTLLPPRLASENSPSKFHDGYDELPVDKDDGDNPLPICFQPQKLLPVTQV